MNFNMFEVPIGYTNVAGYENGYLWEAIGNPGFSSIGLIYSSTKPDISLTLLISNDYLTLYNGWFYKIWNITNMNEFSLLGTIFNQRVTINRVKFNTESFIGTFINKQTNLKINVNDNKIIFDNIGCLIRYSYDGKLVIDKLHNKCLGIGIQDNNNDINNGVYVMDCDDDNGLFGKQSYFYQGTIKSNYNKMCLTVNTNNNLIISNCVYNNNYQLWDIDNKQITCEEPNELYDKYFQDEIKYDNEYDNLKEGYTYQKVPYIMVDPKNPWYVNRNLTKIIKVINSDTELNNVKYPAPGTYGTYKPTNIKLDPSRESLGIGHSLAGRRQLNTSNKKVNKIKYIESFNHNLPYNARILNNCTYKQFIIFILIIFLFIIGKNCYNNIYKHTN